MKINLCLLLFGVVLDACSPATDITGSWKNPDHTFGPINKILVATVTGEIETRQNIENDLSLAMQEKGYQVVKGQDILSPDDSLKSEEERSAFIEKISATDIDVILTVAVMNEEADNRFVPGHYDYEPIQRFEYYKGFWDYYSYRQPTVNTPGFYEEDKVYFLETNLYDAESEELLWSAQSQSYSAGDMASASRDFAAVVIAKMEADGVIRRD